MDSRINRYKLTVSGLILSACILVGCDAKKTELVSEPEPASTLTYSYNCKDAEQAVVVTLTGDSGFLFSKITSQPVSRDAGTDAFIGDDVYYLPQLSPGQEPGSTPGQSARITILGSELTDCKNDARAAVWEAAKLRGVSYRAVGQEPPWALEIDKGNGFLFSTGYEGTEFLFPYTKPDTDSAQGISRFRSELDGAQISIMIKLESCTDSMSGEVFSSRVEIQWRTQTLLGCGRALH